MSILKRTIIIVGCTCLVALALVFFISDAFFLKNYEELEKDSVAKNVNRVTEALSARLEALNTFCYDWAVWDDTYQFAQEYDQQYVDRNLHAETFDGSNLNLIMILNASGTIITGKAIDLNNGEEIALPDDLPDTLSASGLAYPTDNDEGTSGIFLFGGQPMMVVSRQILTSLGEGPSTGSIIMGRFLDSEVISSLSTTTHLSINMLTVTTAGINPEYDSVARSLTNAGPIYIKALSAKSVAGYTFVKDLKGNPVGIFIVDIPRDIYAQGIKTTAVMHATFLFVGILFGGLFVLVIRKLILSRLTALGNSVNKIGSAGDLSSRVSISGNDELSRLAADINDMLGSLKNSEIKRRSQQELIAHLLASTPTAILAFNESENVVLANKAFSKIFSLDLVETMGKNIRDLPVLSALAPEIQKFLKSRSLSSRTELQYRYNGYNKTYVASFARMNEDKISCLVLTDVSEERAKQERLYLTDRLASVGEMASGIAHELNNPLTSVVSLSQMLMEDSIPDNIKEDLGLIHNEAQRAAGIVKNMLSFARKHAPQKQFAQINKIIEDVLKLRTYEHNVTGIRVEKELDPDLPEVMVDYFQIQQVFINIILNAEQAMVDANGQGTLKISSERVDGIIRVSFSDDGPGISPQYLSRIFDPFFTTKEVGKGTGLGLSISYGIVTAHNGTIYARSEIGRGATFIVELPVQTGILKEILNNGA